MTHKRMPSCVPIPPHSGSFWNPSYAGLIWICFHLSVILTPPSFGCLGGSNDSIDKLFDDGNDVELEHPIERDDDVLAETIAKDVSEVAVEKTKKSKQKRKAIGDASGSTIPPKKLSEGYHAATSNIGGKSLATIRGLILAGFSVPSEVAEPRVVAFVTPTPNCGNDGPTYSMSGLNLRTRPSAMRYVVSSDDSYHSGLRSEVKSFARSPVADAPVMTVAVTTTIAADVSIVLVSKDAAKGNELKDLKEKNLALEEEKNILSKKVTTLESMTAAKETELASLSAQVAKLTSDLFGFQLSRDELSSKVASLESERDSLVDQAMQDEQAKVLDNWVAELDAQLLEMDGLKAGTDHGKAERDLSIIEAYDPSAEAKYVDAVNAFRTVDFFLLFVLKSKKDACMDDLMDSLLLEGPLAEIHRAEELQPSLEHLMLHIHRAEDDVVLEETSLSFSLQSLIGEASTFAIPTTIGPITTLSTTFTSSGVVPPLSVSDYQVLDAEPHDEDPFVVTFEEEELDTTPEFELASIFCMACFIVPVYEFSRLACQYLLGSPLSFHTALRERSSYVNTSFVKWPWRCDGVKFYYGFLGIGRGLTERSHGPKKDFLYKILFVTTYPLALQCMALAFFFSSGRISFMRYLFDSEFLESAGKGFDLFQVFNYAWFFCYRPAINASYSASLLVASNLNLIAYVNYAPPGFISISPTPEPSMHDDPSVNNTHGLGSSSLSSMGVSRGHLSNVP
nr:hypothetical protein [Tanacetum cinerariifolium]